jgi:hypothetical protein
MHQPAPDEPLGLIFVYLRPASPGTAGRKQKHAARCAEFARQAIAPSEAQSFLNDVAIGQETGIALLPRNQPDAFRKRMIFLQPAPQ